MDFIKSEVKNIVIFVAILGGLYLSYKTFFKSEAPLTTVTYPDGSGGDVGGEVLALLNELKKIQLSQAIFQDPLFKKLTNFSTELGTEEAGRENPFANLRGGLIPKPGIRVKTELGGN